MVRPPHSPTALVALLALALAACGSGAESVAIPGAGNAAAGRASDTGSSVPSTDSVTTTSDPVGATTPDDSAVEPDTVAPATEPPTTEPPATEPPSTDPPVTDPVDVPPAAEPATTEPEIEPPATEAAQDVVFLRVGDEGDDVASMQFKLSVLEYLPTGSDDGVFDDSTESGLRRFQADYGLGVDGVFGPLTGRALNAAVQSIDVET